MTRPLAACLVNHMAKKRQLGNIRARAASATSMAIASRRQLHPMTRRRARSMAIGPHHQPRTRADLADMGQRPTALDKGRAAAAEVPTAAVRMGAVEAPMAVADTAAHADLVAADVLSACPG